MNEKGKIDIQAIFKAVGTAYFIKNIPSVKAFHVPLFILV